MKRSSLLAVFLLAFSAATAFGRPPSSEELEIGRAWFQSAFGTVAPSTAPWTGLTLIQQDHGTLGRKQACTGSAPLKLANKTYSHGLGTHSTSAIQIRLSRPAESFLAEVGIDNNGDTQGALGSVVFAVEVDGKESYRSEIRRGSDPPLPVEIKLGGATEFLLRVFDGGDGPSHDQADWADASVVYEDGTREYLDELPVFGDETSFSSGLPFSFVYDGKASAEFLNTWDRKESTENLADGRSLRVLVFTDPKTGLEVTCTATEFTNFPTCEWTLTFKNTGTADTPILENIQSANLTVTRPAASEFLLHYSCGADSSATDYAPLEAALEKGSKRAFAPNGGRPTNGAWPYYNVQWGDRGAILAIGWGGQWDSEFSRDDQKSLRFVAGQQLTHFTLHPGEQAQAPRIIMQFWKGGDWIGAQNVWRRWMKAHNMPHPGGDLPKPMLLSYTGRFYEEMAKATEENQLMCLNRYLEERIGQDYWWTDAGWYPCRGSWPNTGTWEVDTTRFPNGLRGVTDVAHKNGMKTLLWFEPERVTPDTWLSDNHPEWLLGKVLLNLGDPEALQWLTDHVDKTMTEQGIDLYRQDFNMDPLEFWRANDTPDRQGMTENKHVAGYMGFWDELQRRRPEMLIDSCASGGRRNDPDAMRRSVPLWRTDHAYRVVPGQCMTHGVSLWLPYYGTGVTACASTAYMGSGETPVEPYAFWSTATPAINLTLDIREKGIDYDALRALIAQWRSVNHYYYGDYYPLTPYSHDEAVWIAWQFHDPETDAGMIQAFRREDSVYRTAELKPQSLTPDAIYKVTDLASGQMTEMTGEALMKSGVSVTIDTQPGVSVTVYSRAN
jgi:alpha-galactosidase